MDHENSPTYDSLPSPVDICDTAAAIAGEPVKRSSTNAKQTWPFLQNKKRNARATSMRTRMVQLYRLRRYEVDALNQTICPSCSACAGHLVVWQNALGAQCSHCRAVLDAHNLRNHLELFFTRESSLVSELEQQLTECLHMMSVLEDDVTKLRLAVTNRNKGEHKDNKTQNLMLGDEPKDENAEKCSDSQSDVHSDDDRVCWAV